MNVTQVTFYVTRKIEQSGPRESSSADADEYEYQVVIVAVLLLTRIRPLRRLGQRRFPRPEANSRLRNAMNDTAAEGVVKLIWKSTEMPSGDLATLIVESPELLRQATAELGKRAAGAAGVGALAIGPVPDVLANLALERSLAGRTSSFMPWKLSALSSVS